MEAFSPVIISVVICTYNRAALLRDILHTVCTQTLDAAHYEVIVVDNNSTDTTPQVADTFRQQYANVHYYLEKKQGASHARNRGWRAAKGAYIAYVDDDCKVPPHWLSTAYTIIQRVAPVEFGGPFYAFYNVTKPDWWLDRYDRFHSMVYADKAGYLPAQQEIYAGNWFIKRSIFATIGDFNPNLGPNGGKIAFGEETELHERLRQHLPDHCAYQDPELYVYHLVQPQKLSLWWQLQSDIAHGRAQYDIYAQQQHVFDGVKVLIWPFYALGVFLVTLVRSWVWRERAVYPAWQNYFFESQRLRKCAARLGVWSAHVQAAWARKG